MWNLKNNVVQKRPTVAAQTLLVKTPDEVSTQVTPRQLGVTDGLEVMTCHRVLRVGLRWLNADVVADQTDGVEVAGLTAGRCSSGRRCSQLNGIIYAQVLQLNLLTLGHPVLCKTQWDVRWERPVHQLDGVEYIHTVFSQRKKNTARLWSVKWWIKQTIRYFYQAKFRKESNVVNSIFIYSEKWCPMFYLLLANGQKQISICNLMQGFTWL